MRVALEITMGRTTLSTQLTTSRPHSTSPTPCQMWLVSRLHAARLPHTTGAPNGSSAIITVSAPISIGAWTPKMA